MIDWCLINVCSWSNAIMTLVLQGELLGWLPRSLPHALQLGHWGIYFNKVSIGSGISYHATCHRSMSTIWWSGVLRHGSGQQRMLAGQLLHAHWVWWMSFHYRSCDFDEEYEKDSEKDNDDETDTDNKLGLVTSAKKMGQGDIFSLLSNKWIRFWDEK